MPSSTLGFVFRQDFGDMLSGSGAELEGGLDLDLPRLGLHLDFKARALVLHSDEVDDWGVSGGVVWKAARNVLPVPGGTETLDLGPVRPRRLR